MSELTSHIKLIVDNAPRRQAGKAKPVSRGAAASDTSSVSVSAKGGQAAASSDVINLVRKENLRAAQSQVPTRPEAEQALRQLQRDLPRAGQDVGGIHSKLDRRVILGLLAPLVMD